MKSPDVPCKITIMIYFGTSVELYVGTDFWILRTINRTHFKSIFFHLYGLLWYFLGPMNKDQELIYEYWYLFFHQNDQDQFYSPYPKIEKWIHKMYERCTFAALNVIVQINLFGTVERLSSRWICSCLLRIVVCGS